MIVFLKTEQDIEGFKKAGKIAADIMSQLMNLITVGSNTNKINEKAIELCEENGVKPAFLGYEGFPAAICASVNNALVHGVPDDKPLEIEDLVSIDLGVDYNGYIGDTAITVIPKLKLDYEVFSYVRPILSAGQKCLDVGISAARAGNKLSDIAKAIESCRGEYSLPDNYGGHGIDRNRLHSAPFIANDPEHVDADITLRAGMILAIEPMLVEGSSKTEVAEDKWTVVVDGPSVHFEHTVLVTDGDPIILTDRG